MGAVFDQAQAAAVAQLAHGGVVLRKTEEMHSQHAAATRAHALLEVGHVDVQVAIQAIEDRCGAAGLDRRAHRLAVVSRQQHFLPAGDSDLLQGQGDGGPGAGGQQSL